MRGAGACPARSWVACTRTWWGPVQEHVSVQEISLDQLYLLGTEHLPTLHVLTQTFCPHVTHDIARSRVAQVVPSNKNISSRCHLSGTPCRLIRTARLPCCSLHCPHPFHLHFPALAQRRFNQEPAPIHTALKVTVLRNPILLQVMGPRWLATDGYRHLQPDRH